MSKIKRVAVGIATGGLSEVARAAKKGLSGGSSAGDRQGIAIDETAFKQKLAGTGDQQAIRDQQQSQSQRLEDRATGAAPSLAAAQLKAATNRSLAQQLAASQAQRGGSSAARERNLMKSQGQARREVAESSAVAAIQEQQAAEQALAQQLQAQRTTDINLADSDRAAAQALQQLRVSQDTGIQQLNQQAIDASKGRRNQFIQSIGQGATAIAASDENSKKNIKKDGEEKEDSNLMKFAKGFYGIKNKEKKESNATKAAKNLKKIAEPIMKRFSDEDMKQNIKKDKKEEFSSKSFLDALQSYTYEYKDEHKSRPEAGEGKRLSVMAQDLEKAGPVGRSMVMNTPQGKVVDYGRGFGAILAAQAELNKRLKDVEKKKK